MRAFTTALCPFWAAMYSGVHPSCATDMMQKAKQLTTKPT
jgi:hypothetical protein